MTGSVLLIDNLDSFTFNLVDAIQRLGAEVRVLRNTVSARAALAAAEDEWLALEVLREELEG